MRLRPIQKKQSFARSNSGIAALEFAFVMPVLLLLMMGIIEFSLIMFCMTVMESATSNTARMGKTGWSAPGTTRAQQIIDNIEGKTSGLLNPDLINITTTVYSDFSRVGTAEPYIDSNHNGSYTSGEPYTDSNGNGQWDADMGLAGVGDAGDVVVYTIRYPWPIFTPFIGALIGTPYNITTRAVVKNEPF